MRNCFVFLIIFFTSVNAWAETQRGQVELLFAGEEVSLSEDTKQFVREKFESIITQCENDSKNNRHLFKMAQNWRGQWQMHLQEEHIRVFYEKPVIVTRRGEEIEIFDLLLSLSEIYPYFNFLSKEENAVRAYSGCNEKIFTQLVCHEELYKYFPARHQEMCSGLEKEELPDGI